MGNNVPVDPLAREDTAKERKAKDPRRVMVAVPGFLSAMDNLISAMIGSLSKRGTKKLAPVEPAKQVPDLLVSLPEKCLVVHEVAARYGNIEKLVIREDGAVFLIETKSCAGTITQESGELRQDG